LTIFGGHVPREYSRIGQMMTTRRFNL